MRTFPILQVDAFTETAFCGNPAAIRCRKLELCYVTPLGTEEATVRAVGNSATAFVDGVEVMRVHELKHRRAEGFIGIWCYRPCYFSLLTKQALAA